jgi:hypothetical protein
VPVGTKRSADRCLRFIVRAYEAVVRYVREILFKSNLSRKDIERIKVRILKFRYNKRESKNCIFRRANADFRQVVGQLESNPVCECLNLRSFLMLPMQRVTRYPLLIAAILQRTEENSQRQTNAQRAYAVAGRVVRQCNEGAKR